MCTVCHTCGEIFLTDEIHLYGTDELCEHCYEDALLGSEYDGEEGKKLCKETKKVTKTLSEESFNGFTKKEKEDFKKLLDKMGKNLKEKLE